MWSLARSGFRISTHALHEEGDPSPNVVPIAAKNFYPRPPRGGRPRPRCGSSRRKIFLPTPSTRRATKCTKNRGKEWGFLPTPSTRRATEFRNDFFEYNYEFLPTPSTRRATRGTETGRAGRIISTHALHEEGDTGRAYTIKEVKHFYPRPPRGGRRCRGQRNNCDIRDFYPRPPRGGRPVNGLIGSTHSNFYPRPPRGGRQQM